VKRNNLNDLTCVFCSENGTVHHLFFECCVARAIWSELSNLLNVTIGYNFELVAKLWLSGKKFYTVNVCSSTVLWSIWKLRNKMIF
jgi:hypothetical protein